MAHVRPVLNVELVEAESKRPFKKHQGPDNNTYVEVEPEGEYFIKVIISVPEMETLCDVKVTFKVDGVDLGYYSPIESFAKVVKNGTAKYIQYAGYYFRENGKPAETSLKFGAPSTRNLSDDQPKTGKIAVRLIVYNKSMPRITQPSHFETNLNGKPIFSSKKSVQTFRGTVKAAAVGDITEKDFDDDEREDNETASTFSDASTGASTLNRSSDGHESSGKTDDNTKSFSENYSVKCGDDGTAEIELNYCSVLGLFHHGVLPKPPLWDWGHHRTVYPHRERDGTPTHADASGDVPAPKRIKLGNAVVEGGVVIQEETFSDYFDLT